MQDFFLWFPDLLFEMASDPGQWIVLVTRVCALLLVTNSILVFILNVPFLLIEVQVESLHLFVFPVVGVRFVPFLL